MLDALFSLPALYLFTTGYTPSWTTSLNILFFYLTWTTLLLSHPALRVELVGTLVLRLIFFWAPTLLLLLVDISLPSLACSLKLQGARSLSGLTPASSSAKRQSVAALRLKILAWGLLNTLLAVAAQAAVEYALARGLGRASGALRASSRLPLPGEILWDVLRGLVAREVAAYYLHRFVLHERAGCCARWHARWQHAVTAPWSACAAFDHPVPYLLLRWVPCYLPAALFRFHLLTWFVFTVLVSLEEVTTHSGYVNIYSLLGGATKRTDTHFQTRGQGNYSPWGLMDWAHGTTYAAPDIKEDIDSDVEVVESRRERSRRRSSRPARTLRKAD